MSESQTDDILVAMLPLLPEQGEPKPLILRYDDSNQKGTFLYDASPLRMDCYIEVLRSSKGSRNHEEKTVTELANQESIPCHSLPFWLRHPELFSHLQSTEFCLETTTNLWSKVMRRREIIAIYHDTIYETQEIKLLLNLLQATGKLIVYDAREIED